MASASTGAPVPANGASLALGPIALGQISGTVTLPERQLDTASAHFVRLELVESLECENDSNGAVK